MMFYVFVHLPNLFYKDDEYTLHFYRVLHQVGCIAMVFMFTESE